jgi:nucleoside-diphosphate-sugar epimerase
MSEAFSGTASLVIGGAGFVGSNLVRRLLESDVERILIVDNLLSAERDNVPDDDRVEFVEASINDHAVLSSLRDEFEWVFHLSTYHGNQSSIHDPLADHEHNTLTTLNLAEALKGFERIRSLVYASAGCTIAEKTFDSAAATTEEDPVSLFLDSPYQISKIIGEFYLNYYFMRYGLPSVKARFQNVYGPGEILGAGRWRGTPATVWRNVIPTFIYRSLKEMPLVLDKGGVATRDFIHVDDIVTGLLACATRGRAGEAYNLASGIETSISELAEMTVGLTGSSSRIEVGEARDWDRSGKRFGSTKKAQGELGFLVRTDLETGLRSTIEWTRANLGRIDAAVSRHSDRLND